MISMEYAKFIFKFNNKVLPDYFDNYFIKLENVHSYNTRKNIAMNISNPLYSLMQGEKHFIIFV